MRCWRTCCILIVVVVLQDCKIKDLSEMLEDMLYIDCCCPVTGL